MSKSNNVSMYTADVSNKNIHTNNQVDKMPVTHRPNITQVAMPFEPPTTLPPPLAIDHDIWPPFNTSAHQTSKGKYPMQTRTHPVSDFEIYKDGRAHQVESDGKGESDTPIRSALQPLGPSALNIRPTPPLPLYHSNISTGRRNLAHPLIDQEANHGRPQNSIDTTQVFQGRVRGSPIGELIAKLEKTAAPPGPRDTWRSTANPINLEEHHDRLSTRTSTPGAPSSFLVRQSLGHGSINNGQHDRSIRFDSPLSQGIANCSAPDRLQRPNVVLHPPSHCSQPNIYISPSPVSGYQSLYPRIENMDGRMSSTNPADMAYQTQLPVVGMSRNYRGNPYLKANQSADIPDEENTSLWITNLPPVCPERLLLGNVKGCGKIYATVINAPDWENGHSTSAAKLVFMYVSGAQALLAQAQNGLFLVDSYVPKVVHNRIKTAAQNPGPESRVLHIEGPKEIVNVRYLNKWFSDRFTFEIDQILVINESEGDGGFRRLEWRFGSYRCQASSAMTFIEKERRRHFYGMVGAEKSLWEDVNVYYGVDPCA